MSLSRIFTKVSAAGCLAFLAAVLAAAIAQAGPFDWFTYTGEGDANNILDVNNWRWANIANLPTGVGVYGHPTSSAQIMIRAAMEGGPVTANVPTGTTINTTMIPGGLELGGGITLNINGGTWNFDNMNDNNVWTDPKTLNTIYLAVPGRPLTQPGAAMPPPMPTISAGYPWYRVFFNQRTLTQAPAGPTGPSHIGFESTIKVHSGGTFTLSGGLQCLTASPFYHGNSVAPLGTADYSVPGLGSIGMDIAGLAHVNVAGTIATGAPGWSGRVLGGGFLNVKGYDASTNINIGTLIFRPAGYDYEGYNSPSDPGRLNITLDSSNTGGNFNTVTATTLQVDPSYMNNQSGHGMDLAVNIGLTLAGYTPNVGDVFHIVHATTIQKSWWDGAAQQTVTGDLGNVTVNGTDVAWDADFTVGAAKYQLHKTYGGQNGIFLEVRPSGVNGTWAASGDGSWSTPATNWVGSAVPQSTGDTATFGSAIGSSTASVTLDGTSPSLKTVTFDNSAGGKYTIAQGSGGVVVLDNAGDAAQIAVTNGSHEISAPALLNSNLAVSVANLADKLTVSGTMTGSGKSLSKSGPGELALTVAQAYTGGVSATAGTLTLGHEDAIPVPASTTGQDLYVGDGAKVVLGTGLPKAVQVKGLTMYGGTTPTGTVDLKNGQLVVDNTVTPVATVAAQIGSGYNPGDPDNPWTGPGITSSSAAADAATYAVGYALNGDFGELAWGTWFGRTVNNDSVLVRYTYQGDADLSGEVTTDDFDNWKQGYTTHLSGWLHGDLDYSGDVTTDDFDLWKQVYVKHYAPMGDGSGGGKVATSAVPEPGTLALLALGGLGLLLWRRRK